MHWMQFVMAKMTSANLIAIGLLWASVLATVLMSYRVSGLPRTWRGFWSHVLPAGLLTHPSAKADVLFFVTKKLVNLVFFAPTVLSGIAIGTVLNAGLASVLSIHRAAAGPISTPLLLLFTVTMFLAYDFSYYVYHNAQHRVPMLWELHKVHHSAEVMVGVTKDRIHPVDDFMNRVWDGCVTGVVYGVWLFFVADPVELTLFGLNVYVLRDILMLDFTRHTHFKISFSRFLNNVVICPHYHQLHHSIAEEHWDKNFGLMLAIWDRMFGTLKVPKDNEDFVFGLTNEEHREYRSFLRLYYIPFVKIFEMAINRLQIIGKVRSHDHV